MSYGGGVASWIAVTLVESFEIFPTNAGHAYALQRWNPKILYVFSKKNTQENIEVTDLQLSNHSILYVFLEAAFRLIWSKLYRCDLDL